MNKSYKQFSLTILQLIIPLSTMTKAEYKETYGIDLDDIDIEKVTLLQDEGSKNKYFVDEIKTTENGVDIYAGGKILSIGSSVSVVNNAYSVANAKPLFWHGVEVGTSSGDKLQLNMVFIMNDDSEIDSVDKLISKIVSFGVDAFINIYGFYNENSENMCNATSFYVAGANQIYLIGNASDCTRVAIAKTPAEWKTLLSGVTGIHVTDRINKLN